MTGVKLLMCYRKKHAVTDCLLNGQQSVTALQSKAVSDGKYGSTNRVNGVAQTEIPPRLNIQA